MQEALSCIVLLYHVSLEIRYQEGARIIFIYKHSIHFISDNPYSMPILYHFPYLFTLTLKPPYMHFYVRSLGKTSVFILLRPHVIMQTGTSPGQPVAPPFLYALTISLNLLCDITPHPPIIYFISLKDT